MSEAQGYALVVGTIALTVCLTLCWQGGAVVLAVGAIVYAAEVLAERIEPR